MKKSIIVMIVVLSIVLIAGGGTVAWLVAQDSISNTFSVGQIAISLSEPAWSDSCNKIYPGAVIPKDPTVTVAANSEDCYVYVMIDNKLNDTVAGAVTLDIQSDWTLINTSGSKKVYRYSGTSDGVVSLSSSDKVLQAVFTKVSVSGEVVTEANINSLNNKTIVIKAYAHQANGTTQAMTDSAALAHFANP